MVLLRIHDQKSLSHLNLEVVCFSLCPSMASQRRELTWAEIQDTDKVSLLNVPVRKPL